MTVVVLAGGTGGAKLARGVAEVVGDDLVVIANTGDDVEIHGGHVSPDPDLVTFWLDDVIDERGWGLRGDTFAVMDELRRLGEDVWFSLGDRDLAWCLARARRLAAGERLTSIVAELSRGRVLPMCDEPVRTFINGRPFQEWMIRVGGEVESVESRGRGTVSPEVRDALGRAERIVIGPSNPVISIGPILHVLGDAIRACGAPVIAVSPLVGREVVKGPTAAFLRWAGVEQSPAGVASHYGDLLDGMVADEECPGVPTLVCDVAMPDVGAAARLARDVVGFFP